MEPLEQVVKILKAENQNFKQNFDKVRRAYSEQQKTVDNLTAKIQLLEADKTQLENDHLRLVAEWKEKLTKKALEFDQVRKEIIPVKDLTVVKAEAFAEYHEALKAQNDLRSSEVDKWRNLFFTVQKDFEAFKIGLHDKEMEYRSAIEDISSEFQQEIIQQRQKIAEKNEALDDSVKLGMRMRELQRENNDFVVRTKGLVSDIEHFQSKLVDEQTRNQLTAQNLKRQILDKDSELQNMKTDRDSLKTKSLQLEEELRKFTIHQDELYSEANRLREEIGNWNNKYDILSHQFKIEKSDANFAFVKERALFDQKLKQMESLMSEKDQQIELMKQNNEQAQIQNMQMEQKRNQEIHMLKESNADDERKLKEKISDLEKECSKLEHSKATLVNEYKHQIDAILKEREAAEAKMTHAILEAQTTSKSNEDLLIYVNDLKEKLENVSIKLKQSEEQGSKHMIDLQNLKRREQDSIAKIADLEEKLFELQREMTNNQDDEQRMHKKWIEKEQDLQKSLDDLNIKNKQLMESNSSQRKENEEQSANMILAMKKLKQGYKKRVEELETVREELEEENETLRKSLQNENHETQLRMKEMFRKQQEFARFLQSEGIFSTGQN